MQSPLSATTPGWHAQLKLGFRKTVNRTILSERFRQGPLSVQRALYPEADLCHIYLLHPPGGVVGGDRLDIQVDVTPLANALITTPGAAKFYRSLGPIAHQQQRLDVCGGSLEWFPQENILFPSAQVELKTEIRLRDGARFIGWEINCLGRPAIRERFDPGRADFKFSLWRDDQPLLIERMLIKDRPGLDGLAGLGGKPVVATMLATLDDDSLLDEIRQLDNQPQRLGITHTDGLLIVRYLGDSTEQVRNHFIRIWQLLRPTIINRPACEPRVWNT
ncbi:MAG: urease accessory protein UreD [Candidatus Thiodiazotropha taylori]|nr:urease accessory protein UreD [Candidatus Thiodiazotropha taylori]MCG7934574.1 urease accessory protein UreD [Candidatus Thiodiazotropha taylori]MCG7970462.1 urease accessory protein UreD [Candidatus Thiodiazotropha taylori]MCG8072296.1 urease accessory protein UreD [Candidatus Thiodiazotropha taylori]MCW4326313.1 urease accessory protein UreD [Candidatus Thiodiazotropha taylori]